ncbi:MAG: amino acid adenylation domain-containing protein, partial [Anaerolineales bacterium]
RPPEMSFRGGMIPINFGDELSASVHELATRTGSTSFMVILAGLAALLHRYTGMQDIVIGTPVANRTHLDLEGMIGFFVNSLPVRFDLSGEPTFEQLLAQTRTKTLQALTYQNLPFELLVKRMHIERDLSRHPIFQVIVSMRVGPGHPTIMDAVEIETYPLDTEVSRFDINLMLWQQGAQVSGHWEFSTDLYNRTTIERFSQHFLRFLKNVVSNPQQTISNILLIDEDEQKRLLSQTRTPATFTPPVACIHERFEAQVDRTPHAVAVEYEGETLTYHALNQHANRLAHLLIDRGVRPDQMVGLCVQPSLNLVVAILGILKAGGAYVPLDPNYPLRRLQFMLDDASIDLVVSEEASRSKIMRKGTSILALDSEADRIAAMPDENPKVNVKPDNLAYVIYTSGSTGQPKGALIAHSNVIQLFEGSEESCRFGPDDTWALFHSFTFDFSVWELFGALFYGGRLIVIPVSMRRSLDTYFKKVVFKRLTILAMIPPLFFEAALMPQFFDRLAGSKLRHIFLGGDVLDVSKLAPFFQRDGAKPIRITNVYGPTETTVFVTWHEVSRKDLDQASGSIIGRPLDGASIFIFDSHLNLLPVGVPGEIVVGGLGVSRGYLNRPELDHQRFIEHPLDPRPDSRFYRTGDVGRIRADGELEYLGRQDDQVKIRGFRVETGEIEVVLAQHEAVQGCVVKVGKEHQADETLWAYVAPKEGMSLTKQDLESYLGSQLPEYMLPNRYFILDKIPLTSTGKIDRSALSGGAYEELSDSGGYVAPRDPLESQIAAIWEQILGVQPVGRNDNFFDLGGHSLLALQLLSALRIATGVDLSVAALFQAPTVAKQARLIKKREWKPSGLALIPIQEGGRGKPIFFVHWAGGSVLVYRKLIQLLDPTLRIYGLQAYGMDRSVRPHTRIEQMAAHYVSEIRELQPKGPYYLAGASMGGSIAFEMARQLRDDGEEVGLVALFDTIGGPNLGTLPLRERVQLHADNIRERQSALGYLWERTVIRLRRMLYAAVIGLGIPLPHRMWNLKETTYYAFKHYRPGVYSGNVVLFRATERGPGIPKSAFLGWEKVVSGGISIVDVPGKHSTVLSEPGVRVVAKNLDVLLADAKEAVRPGSKPEETSS